MIVYKLTNQEMQTCGGFQWKLGEIKEASGEGPLCSSGWLHSYEDPLLAVLHNPIHAAINSPRMFTADTLGGRVLYDLQLKLGSTQLVLLEEIRVPQITTAQRVAYGILCALEVCKSDHFTSWAERWLSGEDRSADAAAAAAWREARAATWANAAARAARAVEADAAWSRAAEAAGWAALAAWVARTAAAAAWAATAAAREANAVGDSLDLSKIAEKAMTYQGELK